MKIIFTCIISVFFLTSVSLAGQNNITDGPHKSDVGNSQSPQILAFSFKNTPVANEKKTINSLRNEEIAEPADAKSQYALGMLYLEGKAKPLNYIEAARCFEIAAKQGMPEAQYQLGMLYEKGKGVPQNYKQAAEWYKKAVRQDCVSAQNALGFLYYNGKGVPRDLVISLALFNIAAAAGDDDAFQNTYIAASTMSFKSFDKAKALAGDRKRLYRMIGG